MTTGRHRSIVAAAAFALSLTAPLTARAEPQNRIVGTVADFHGKYGLIVRDQRGALAEVTLHQGTVIKPVGLRLERGMTVNIVGRTAEGTFAAAEIVAPFAQVPTALATVYAARARAAEKSDTMSLMPNRPSANTRWQEGPDQLSLPTVREPASPH